MPLTQDQIDAITLAINQQFQAQLRQNVVAPGAEMHVETFTLTTAQDRNNPFYVPFDCIAFRVKSATDLNTTVSLLIDSKDISQPGSPYFKGDVFLAQGPHRCYFFWAAQAGKTITIEFYKSSQSLPGSLGVSVSQVQTSVATTPCVAVTNVAAQLIAANLDRKNLWICSLPANTDTIYVSGSSTVAGKAAGAGGNIGIPLPPGGVMQIANTAQLYAISDSGSQLITLNEEK